MMIWHLTFSAQGRHPFFPNEQERRRAVRSLVRVVGPYLVLFCIVDEHIHLVVIGERALAGRLAQMVALAMQAIAATPLQRAYFTPVESRSHMLKLADYLLGQPAKHGLPARR